MTDTVRVVARQTRFGETEHIDAVEYVGLAHAVESDEAIDFRRQSNICLCEVAVV